MFLLLVLAVVSGKTIISGQEKKPNIIFILADDLGYGDVGFNGQKLIKTPNLDRLAQDGIVFKQFYAGTAVCAPSRCSLMTGKHTGHTVIRDNLGIEPEGQYPISDNEVTIAEVLKKGGYKTGAFGKWGLGFIGSEGDPNNQGFDTFFGYNCQSLAHRYYPEHLWNNQQKIILKENDNLEYNKQYAPDIIQKEALAFIDKNKQEPFFLFLPYILPHAELLVPDDSIFRYYKDKFTEKPFKGFDYGKDAKPTGYVSQNYPHATYAAMVARLDLYVGQVIDKLNELGLEENTLIIFTSDNGPHKEGGGDPDFFNSSAGFTGIKRDLYEGGIRVPFVAKWPKVITPGQNSEFIGAFWDILPTFSEIAGITNPDHIDGISLINTLKGGKNQKEHEYLYWEFHKEGGKQAVRYRNWKGIRLNLLKDKNASIALYDINTDPHEKRDVSSEHPDIIKKITSFMNEDHLESTIFSW